MATAAVLYVEDDENDALLMEAGFRRAKVGHFLQVVTDGEQALDYLAGNGRFADRVQYPLPALVLLDLNLPVRSGFEVLEWLRRQPQFHSLPVVVFSASCQDADVAKARQLGASEFLSKPADMFELGGLVQGITDRWLPSPG